MVVSSLDSGNAVISRTVSGTVLVLGSGPIRIGQGIEFDYSCVHCVWALKRMGYRAVILNNNPETVSTDFDTGDGLYFEPVTANDVLAIAQREDAMGVVCQFGGQTAINLASPLSDLGLTVLGTSPEAIAAAEDRELFDALLNKIGVLRPKGKAVRSMEEGLAVAEEVGFPVLVRPSFVLGGRAMDIIYSAERFREFYGEAEQANPGQPVLVDRYIVGKEAELDVICDGEDTFVPGIMEHIERSGVHSGDSMAIYPPTSISRELEWQMVVTAQRIARALGVRGLMNVQFVVEGNNIYVIEVNPRASRTVPYLSKVTGIPMVQLATRCMMGEKLKDMGYANGLWCTVSESLPTNPIWEASKGQDFCPDVPGKVAELMEYLEGRSSQSRLFAVKAPVFSFQKLRAVEPSLGPEMKSTGEVMGVDRTQEAALFKAMIGSGIQFKPHGKVVLTLNEQDKEHAVEIARALLAAGYEIVATAGTHGFLQRNGIASKLARKMQEGGGNLLDLVLSGDVSLMINTPGLGQVSSEEAREIRRACIETGVACVTNVDTARALARAIPLFANPDASSCEPYTAYR